MKNKIAQLTVGSFLLFLGAFVVSLSSCNALADTSGLNLTPETVWLHLVPGVPFEGDDGVWTAELVLDLSRAISGLNTDTTAAELYALFTISYDYSAEAPPFKPMVAASVIKYTEGYYKLTVGNIPASRGVATLTINRPGITPASRLWDLAGREIPDSETLTLSFDTQGGSSVDSIIGIGGAKVNAPAPPVKEGHYFEGWFDADSGGSPVDWPITLTGNITVYAHWAPLATFADAPAITLEPGTGQLGYTITPSNPQGDSYTVSWLSGYDTDAAHVKAGTAIGAGTTLGAAITGLANAQVYSVIVCAHKENYADSYSVISYEAAVTAASLPQIARRYVKTVAAGNGSGTSWNNAAADIQLMIDELYSSGGEVWVAGGTYIPGNTQQSTFTLKTAVKVYGGFPPSITDDWALGIAMNARIFRFKPDGTIKPWAQASETLLSGDLNNDDVYASGTGFLTGNYSDNAEHVVTGATGADATALLDGFTVRGGSSATGGGAGGGILNNASSPSLSKLTITGNRASELGGGIANLNSWPTLTNATLRGNTAACGGGIGNGAGANDRAYVPIFTNVIITGNSADNGGGGMYNMISSPIITNAAITGNTTNGIGGGGSFDGLCSPTYTNVIIAGNSTSGSGGGIWGEGVDARIRNCIVWGNTANSAANVYMYVGTKTWTYSLVEGASWDADIWGIDSGNTNLASSTDPFVDVAGGDYRLKAGIAGAIDAGDPSMPAEPPDWQSDTLGAWSSFWDALTDLDGLPRFNGTVDRGAYEKQ
ncbi:MAG: InlB B-repeat-containing protein [Spirochaetaceae bacterium]|jgi:uncharacterized repeat protein (TIGR02543 family)|nr:InlB B-repeat-containing protein [Spirochaetaceae bacterium]